MPRPTAQQLSAARIAKQKQRDEEEKKLRQEQEALLLKQQQEKEAFARKFAEDQEKGLKEKQRLEQLISVTDALYLEIDKLNKKAPEVPISELTLERVNKLIIATKDMIGMGDDEFIDDIKILVAAGDMPEYRDTALIISQLRAGQQRFERANSQIWSSLGIK